MRSDSVRLDHSLDLLCSVFHIWYTDRCRCGYRGSLGCGFTDLSWASRLQCFMCRPSTVMKAPARAESSERTSSYVVSKIHNLWFFVKLLSYTAIKAPEFVILYI